MAKPAPNMMTRVQSTLSWGPLVGIWALFYTVLEAVVLFVTELLWPASEVDIARCFDSPTYNEAPAAYGQHDLVVDFEKTQAKDKPVERELSLSYNSLDVLSESEETLIPLRRRHKLTQLTP
jgi:hypothetical protein